MANKLVEEVEVRVETTKAKQSAKDFEKTMGKMFDKSAMKAMVFNQALGLGMKALGGITASLKEGIKASMDYHRTTEQLKTTLRGLGDVGLRNLDLIQKQSSEYQRLTGISDEVTRGYQIIALNAGIGVDELDGLMKASIRLSNAFKIDLGSAMKNLIKTKSGMAGELSELVPWIKTLSKEQLLAGEAISIANEKLDGQLEVLTKGSAGATMGLTNAWGDFTEALFVSYTDDPGVKMMISGITEKLVEMTEVLTDPDKGLIWALKEFALASNIFTGFAKQEDEILKKLNERFGETSEKLPSIPEFAPLTADAGLPGIPEFAFPPKKPGKDKRKGRGVVAGNFASSGIEQYGYDPEEAEAAQAQQQELIENMLQTEAEAYVTRLESAEAFREQKKEIEARSMAEEVALVQKKEQEKQQIIMMGINTAISGIEMIAAEGLKGALKWAFNTMRGVGMWLFGHGMADSARATALMTNPFTMAQGIALEAAAVNEMAIGGSLAAGGIIGQVGMTVAGKGGGSKGGGGGRGGGSADFSGGDVERTGQQEAEGKTIIININGPSMNSHQFGKQVQESLNEVNRRGL
jgi:hypothetical protein